MNLHDLLPDGVLDALASHLGIPPEQARRGAEALLPSVLGGLSGAGAPGGPGGIPGSVLGGRR